MNELLNEGGLSIPQHNVGATATTDKGKQIMEGLLLNQYQNSPDLQEYIMCFVAEMDFLFEQIEKVYFGRFIEAAEGAQLDVIGIILQIPRAASLPNQWFGFQDAPDAAGMANASSPAIGGLFRDANVGSDPVEPLDDITYKKMLLAKAALINRNSCDTELVYYVISILLGRVPSVFELRGEDSVYEKIVNGTFDTDISGWTESRHGTGANLSWNAGKIRVIPPNGENGYAEQVIETLVGDEYNFKVDYDNEVGSECKILIGTLTNVNRYYTSFGQPGSGSVNINFIPDLYEPTYVRIGSVEQNTWSDFDNVSVLSASSVGKRQIELVVSGKDISTREVSVIEYMSKYFVPTGINFNVRRI